MNRPLSLRIAFDIVAASLLMVALAYYWLDNAVHEFVGTGLFLLLALHNVFNRRWYGSLAKTKRQARGLFYIVVNGVLLVAVFALLVTSLMISRTVFGFLDLGGGFTARQVHTLAAYWMIIIVSIHIGFKWTVIMSVVREALPINVSGGPVIWSLRIISVAIAVLGLKSSFDLTIGDKLSMQLSIEFWDFNETTIGFFWRLLAIVGLYIALTHYALGFVRARKRRSAV